jgi:amino-acid N-acetyltransferase
MMIDGTTAERYAKWFACLADPTRIRLLNALASEERSMTVHELVVATGVSQPTVSHHLKMLAKSRFVLLARRGTATDCALNENCLEQFPAAALEVLGIGGARLDHPAPLPNGSTDEKPPAAPALRRAREADLGEVASLLAMEGLPLEGLRENVQQTWIAEAEGRIQACSAIEFYGTSALLRSVAVARDRRRQGLGRQIVEAALKAAAERASRVYLLTEGASGFFKQLGFRPVARGRVPANLRRSTEFSVLCPVSAEAMTRSIHP